MMILTAVTVTMALNGGLFNYAGKARTDTLKAMAREEVQVAVADYKMESIINGEESIVFGDFMNAMLTDNITAFVESDENWRFNYKDFGFIVNKEDLSIEVGDPVKIFKLVTSASEIEANAEYLIAGGRTGTVKVLDEYINDPLIGRGSAQYNTSANHTIYYDGEYAIKFEKKGEDWTLYDSKNKQYLTAENEDAPENDNILDLSTKKAYFNIDISADSNNPTANIVYKNKETRNTLQLNGPYFSCYDVDTQGSVYLFKYIGESEPQILFTPKVNVNVESKKITLFWNPIAHAKNYTIKWNGEDIITEETTYVFDNLNNGEEFTFQVRANKDVSDNERQNSSFTEPQTVIPSSGEYKLVETIDELASGARYVIYTYNENDDQYYVPKMMGGQQDGQNRRDAIDDISVVNNIIKHNGLYAVKLESAGNNLWRIKDVTNSQYIYSSANKSINIGTNVNNANYKFSIDIINGKAIITSQGNAKLQYNSGSTANFFSFYTSNLKPISLFKEIGGAESTQLADPIVVANVNGKNVTLSWNQSPNAVSYTVIWNDDETYQNITSDSWSIEVDEDGTYSYRVMAVGNNSPYASSNYVSGSVDIITETTNVGSGDQYQLITSNNDLEEDTEYLIVTAFGGKYYALGEDKSSKRLYDEVTVSGDIINYTGQYALTLSKKSEADGINFETNGNTYYKFYDENKPGYLKGKSSGTDLYAYSNKDEYSYFTISIANNGIATITNRNNRKLKFNSKSGQYMFRLYTDSTQNTQEVYLYKKIKEDIVATGEIYLQNTEYKDKNNEKAMIPKGFGIVKECTTISKGLVISDRFNSNGDSIGNEFVWIPVPEKNMVVATLNAPYEFNGYSEPVELTGKDNNTSSQTGGPYAYDSQNELDYYYGKNYFTYATDFAYSTHYNEMATSVNKYGGFYIGRYEATIDSSNNIGSKYNTPILTGATTISGTNKSYRWWGLYYAGRYSNIEGNGSTIQTNMMWGQQWEKMIAYFDNKSIDYTAIDMSIYNKPSGFLASGQATYTHKTNNSKIKDEIFNIYDLRMNTMEFTALGYRQDLIDNCRITYGGWVYNSHSASNKSGCSPSVSDSRGTRLTLYIK